MAVQIRLARHGSRKKPFYRIVVTDIRNPRDGRYIERLGTFNPMEEPVSFVLDRERMDYWRKQGAKVSATLDRLVKSQPAPADAAS